MSTNNEMFEMQYPFKKQWYEGEGEREEREGGREGRDGGEGRLIFDVGSFSIQYYWFVQRSSVIHLLSSLKLQKF